MARAYIPVHPHDRQWREDDPAVIAGVRRADGSGWVDTSDPFVCRVGEQFSVDVKISPYSTLNLHGTVERIARVDIRTVGYSGIVGTGFNSLARFFEMWVEQYDPDVARAVAALIFHEERPLTPAQAAETYRHWMAGRPAERYQAWEMDLRL